MRAPRAAAARRAPRPQPPLAACLGRVARPQPRLNSALGSPISYPPYSTLPILPSCPPLPTPPQWCQRRGAVPGPGGHRAQRGHGLLLRHVRGAVRTAGARRGSLAPAEPQPPSGRAGVAARLGPRPRPARPPASRRRAVGSCRRRRCVPPLLTACARARPHQRDSARPLAPAPPPPPCPQSRSASATRAFCGRAATW